jgi:HAD superfamily hydrolase (TIGR01509 family)
MPHPRGQRTFRRAAAASRQEPAPGKTLVEALSFLDRCRMNVQAALPEVLLFDLGGVLVFWDGIEPLQRFSRRPLTREDARRFWMFSPWVRRFERGQCTPAEFAAGAVEELSLAIPPDAFIPEFLSWDRGPLPGALELLETLAPRFRLACLSNNNELHWSRLRGTFARWFERCYLSHELGMMKPDPEIFRHAISDLGCPADRILFLDDNPECVETAVQSGMKAAQARGVEGAREALSAFLGQHAGQQDH